MPCAIIHIIDINKINIFVTIFIHCIFEYSHLYMDCRIMIAFVRSRLNNNKIEFVNYHKTCGVQVQDQDGF